MSTILGVLDFDAGCSYSITFFPLLLLLYSNDNFDDIAADMAVHMVQMTLD